MSHPRPILSLPCLTVALALHWRPVERKRQRRRRPTRHRRSNACSISNAGWKGWKRARQFSRLTEQEEIQAHIKALKMSGPNC